jgi:mono/diheme cytochrome c family protein
LISLVEVIAMRVQKQIFRIFSIFLLAGATLLATGYLVSAREPFQDISQGQSLYNQKCKACHTIGDGPLIGPDLKDVTQQRDVNWIKAFITAPDQVIASGDPVATQLVAQYKIKMPNLGLTATDVDALLAYLSNPTAGSAALTGAAPALPKGDPQRGKAIFEGATALQNGGTHCIACHTVAGISTLGGGSLGPDLTHILTRLGRPGLASALETLPFPTMQGVFLNRLLTPTEQGDLLAFFVQADKTPAPSAAQSMQWFLLAAGVGVLVLFLVMALYWPRQRKSISDQLRDRGK